MGHSTCIYSSNSTYTVLINDLSISIDTINHKQLLQGLAEREEYLFRVRAANANGTGPPLEGVNPVKTPSPFDVPSPPGAPDITEVGGDFVNLTWEKPETDGGSRSEIMQLFVLKESHFNDDD